MTAAAVKRADAWNRAGLDLKQLIVLTDEAAVSFCHYPSPARRRGAAKRMPLRRLDRVLELADERRLDLQFILSAEPLPAEYERRIDRVPHVKIAPPALGARYGDAMLVLNSADLRRRAAVRQTRGRNIVVRLEKSDLPRLAALLVPFPGEAGRINLALLDLGAYEQTDVDEYARQLEALQKPAAAGHAAGRGTETNFLTDRLALRQMNNCDAGVRHLTCAPDGKLHLCPGFYHDGQSPAVGDLETGIDLKNAQLLRLDHAPICRICDAFQCRRCVYLNLKTTLEWNTPSWQQCVLAHHERNASRALRRALADAGIDVSRLTAIPEIDYLDPLNELTRRRDSPDAPATPASKSTQQTDRDLLLQILNLQRQILAELKRLTKGDDA